MNVALTIALCVVGFLYLYEWSVASNRCSAKWLMFTPIWFLFPSKFDEQGKRSCWKALTYVVVGLPISILLIFKLGIW
jgi:hypothetical protein